LTRHASVRRKRRSHPRVRVRKEDSRVRRRRLLRPVSREERARKEMVERVAVTTEAAATVTVLRRIHLLNK
jgi:hypothetical protein